MLTNYLVSLYLQSNRTDAKIIVFFRVMKVGKKLQGEGKDIYFSVSNHKDFSFELGEFGLNDVKGDKPIICARDDRDMKYIMSGDFRFVA